MAKLLGTKPNQAPTNNDLGDLAYQDGDNAVIGPITIVDGDVGIGTSSPERSLHISTSSPTVRLQDSDGTNQYGEIEMAGGNFIIQSRNDTSDGGILFRGVGGGSATERMRITAAGNVGIATTNPTTKLDVNDDSIRVRTAKTPASASDTGTQGQIAWDADYIYICVATDTWKRAAISTW